MTNEEEQLLKGLAERVSRAQVGEKDAEAERLIRQQIGSNPDALYILAQTTLVQEYALNQARRQMDELRAQLEQAKQSREHTSSSSFLGGLLGHRDQPRTPPPPPPVASRATDQVSGVGPGLAYPSGGYPIPGSPAEYPAQSGFLRSALQTATGVAAGALAFEGIESLLHGFGGHAGYGGERSEIINNYYGNESGREHAGMTDAGASFADSMGPHHTALEADHNTGLNEGSYLGGGAADRDELAATGDRADRDEDSLGVGDDDIDYSAPSDDSVTSDDVGDDDSDAGDGDFGGDDGGGGDDGSGF